MSGPAVRALALEPPKWLEKIGPTRPCHMGDSRKCWEISGLDNTPYLHLYWIYTITQWLLNTPRPILAPTLMFPSLWRPASNPTSNPKCSYLGSMAHIYALREIVTLHLPTSKQQSQTASPNFYPQFIRTINDHVSKEDVLDWIYNQHPTSAGKIDVWILLRLAAPLLDIPDSLQGIYLGMYCPKYSGL